MLVALVVVAGLLIAVGGALAEPPASTEPSARSTASEPVVFPPGPDDNPPAGVAAALAPAATFSYYTVAGATMRGRQSATTIAYDGKGCVHTTAAADAVNAEFNLPSGSVIKYLRLYYVKTAAGSVTGYITYYRPGVDYTDLSNVTSGAATTGYGTALSSELTHTVDHSLYAYTLIGWPSAASSTLQVCGLRVAYYAPGAAAALPTVFRSATHP